MPAEPGQTLYVIEPAGAYRPRSVLVADCSAIAAMVFDEARYDEAVAALVDRELVVPHLIDHEIVNVAAKKARAGATDAADAGLDAYETLSLSRCGVDRHAQLQLALDHDLSAYDAAYLQLAIAMKVPLVTFDERLHAAASRALAR
jgi:predicted nucleic acid-binding protein